MPMPILPNREEHAIEIMSEISSLSSETAPIYDNMSDLDLNSTKERENAECETENEAEAAEEEIEAEEEAVEEAEEIEAAEEESEAETKQEEPNLLIFETESIQENKKNSIHQLFLEDENENEYNKNNQQPIQPEFVYDKNNYWNYIGLVNEPSANNDTLFEELIQMSQNTKKVAKNDIQSSINNVFSYYQYLNAREVHFIQNLKNIRLPASVPDALEEKPILLHIGSPFHIGFWKMQNADHPIHQYPSICYLNELSEQENMSIVADNLFEYICYNPANRLYSVQDPYYTITTNAKNNSFTKTKLTAIQSNVYMRWDYICNIFQYPHDSRHISEYNLFFIILLDLLETNIRRIVMNVNNFSALFAMVDGEKNLTNPTIIPGFADFVTLAENNEILQKKIHILRWIYIREPRIILNETQDRELLQLYDHYIEEQKRENKKIRLYQYQNIFWNVFKKSIELIQIRSQSRNQTTKNGFIVRFIPFSLFEHYIIHNRGQLAFTNTNEILFIYQDKFVNPSVFIQWVHFYKLQIQNNVLNGFYHNVLYLVNDYSLYQNTVTMKAEMNPQNMNDMMNADTIQSVQKIVYIMQNETWDEVVQQKMQGFFRTRKAINNNLKWLMYIFFSYSSFFEKNSISMDKEIFKNLPEYEKLFYLYMGRRKYFSFSTEDENTSLLTF